MDYNRGFVRAFFIVVVAIIAIFTLGASFYTDFLWFVALGYKMVFTKLVLYRLTVGGATGLFIAAFIFINLLLAKGRRRIVPGSNIIDLQPGIERFFDNRIITWVMLALSAALGGIIGTNLSRFWILLAQFLNRSSFGVVDPVFNNDIGFYIFTLPMVELLYQVLVASIVIGALAAGVIYVITMAIGFSESGLVVQPRARAHMSVLLGLFLVTKAIGYRINLWKLLYSSRGVAFGASFTDVNAQALALNVLAVVAIVGAVALFANAWLRRMSFILWIPVALLVLSLALGSAYPALMQQFVVEPNEFDKEAPFIDHNISFTRLAYGLDEIQIREFAAEGNLSMELIQQNQPTIANIRLWDIRPLLDTYEQLQALRLYYRFVDVDVDRYQVGGTIRQVALSLRELNTGRLPSQTWVNNHLHYTHGYGAVVSPVTEVASEGRPILWVKNLPPVAGEELLEVGGEEDLALVRPEVYYGETTDQYVIVKTLTQEYDFPVGDVNAYTTYDGDGGVPLSSSLHKAAFAWRLGAYQMLFSTDITPESRVMLYRNVLDRTRKLAPFLRYDDNPYPVISEGRIFWIVDAYTVSSRYPYSQPHRAIGANYIRNSVKVVIDAFNGSVDFYIVDDADPVIQTYDKAFPGLFQDISAMPSGVRAHIRYPETLFKIQSDMFSVYHMQNARVFYQQEDLWQVAREIAFAASQQEVQPYYVVMSLPGLSEEAEYVLMLPFTPTNKNNMVAWMSARNDGEHYGELHVFTFPKQKQVDGPLQIESRIDQDSEIAKDLTLWSQRGSEVFRGNLLVIPIADSILYVEPIYLQAEQNKFPELKKVVVAFEDRLVMTDTLEEALTQLFGEGIVDQRPGDVDGAVTGTLAELISRANNLYETSLEALKAGNWPLYGETVEELGQVLDELERNTTQEDDIVNEGPGQ